MDTTYRTTSLPDPDYDAEFYEDVAVKRLFAWGIDVVLISLVVAVLVTMSLFVAAFFLPALYFFVSFLYRWLSISVASATLGMRLMSIQFRDRDGRHLDTMTALLHTTGYAFSVITVPLQLISIVLMLTTSKRQGLTDLVLGTAAINRPYT